MKGNFLNTLQVSSRIGEIAEQRAKAQKALSKSKPLSAPAAALPSPVSTAIKVAEVVQTVLTTAPAITSVIPAPPIPPVVQPRWWELVKSPFIQTQLQHVMMGLVMNQAQNVSLYLLSRALHYFRGRDDGEATNLAVVTRASEVTQNKYGELIGKLTPLIIHFHDAMRSQANRLEQADQSLALSLQEAIRLQLMFDALTEDDLNGALKNLTDRLNVIVSRHQENLPILLAVMDDLKAAESDLAEAVATLEATKREFNGLVEELAMVKFLIESAGLEQDRELKALVQRLEWAIGGFQSG